MEQEKLDEIQGICYHLRAYTHLLYIFCQYSESREDNDMLSYFIKDMRDKLDTIKTLF